jgi:hypothetical protein
VAAAANRRIMLTQPLDLQESPGLCVVHMVAGKPVVLGRPGPLAELAVTVDSEYLGRVVGMGGLERPPRFVGLTPPRSEPGAGRDGSGEHHTLDSAHRHRRAAARDVGAALGVDDVIAEVLPAEEAWPGAHRASRGPTVMMVRDRVNDAPRWDARTSEWRSAPN